MCGIAGILGLDGQPAPQSVLERMTAVLAHRGPDGHGTHVSGAVGLGNRRLAILDLSAAGAQPMLNEAGDVALTYNGEVYNFRELRAELERTGRPFRSHSDTEVVLRAYEEWGPRFVERLNGMFALAVWDGRSRTLLLARDRYGIKPLYTTRVGSTFLFASEIKSFLEHPDFRPELSPEHLLEYFTFQNVFTDGTLFRGVTLLPPGQTLTIGLDGGEPVRRTYWDFEFAEQDGGASDEEYAEELDRLFAQAVERQLVSDVPVGAFLSGGMDSGSITAVATRTLPRLATFTGGFDLTSASGMELAWDEREKAEAMSYAFGTEQYETVLKAGDMERCLPALTWHLEDPRVGQSYPNYYIARLASKFVKVALSGAGGDELFAGYPWRYYRAVVNDDFDDYVAKYYGFWHRLIPNTIVREFFTPDVWSQVGDIRTIDIFRSVLPPREPSSPEEYVNHSLYLEAKTFLHGLLLVDDKLSMAHGLETRVPFLDNDLVDFAQRLPVRLKLRELDNFVRLDENEPGDKTIRYFERTRDGKLLLRQVMERHVPQHVTSQVKQGFSGPDAAWFRGESLDFVRRVTDDPDARMYAYLDPGTVRKLVDEHLSGRENRRLLLWSLLNFEQWCRVFLDGERPELV
ncbi:MAG TPA: asparagine synthase (glutamine-hydrolyzing) [Gaiellaceae bacterium]|nr:asparagine synthase (glutamine-hydrolyzing) [Gaiellaceae bacterium]